MTGGLLQLVAFGAQDIYLSGNAQVTFFKLVYRRHTNFAQETIEQTFGGNPGFGRKVTATLSRNGDLVHRIWLMIGLPAIKVPTNTVFRWLNWIGHVMISWVEFEIGGQKIDRQYGEWMHIYSELTTKAGHKAGYANMVGNVPKLTNPVTDGTIPGITLYVPLQFYFCRNPGLCLPLVALQYHEVKVTVEFRPFEECVFQSGSGTRVQAPDIDASLLVDYIFLDTDERRRFAQVSHEYLITQIQYTGDEVATNNAYRGKLSFNHPTKELIWVAQKQSLVSATSAESLANYGRQWYNYSTSVDTTWLTGAPNDINGGGMWGPSAFGDMMQASSSNLTAASPFGFVGSSNLFNMKYDMCDNPVKSGTLQLNGHDRFSKRDGRWFNLCVPYATHENVPPVGINVYNFALRPEEHQPSGSLNFSRIDSAVLSLELDTPAAGDSYRVKVFAVSYNILRVLSGMGGLAYSD